MFSKPFKALYAVSLSTLATISATVVDAAPMTLEQAYNNTGTRFLLQAQHDVTMTHNVFNNSYTLSFRLDPRSEYADIDQEIGIGNFYYEMGGTLDVTLKSQYGRGESIDVNVNFDKVYIVNDNGSTSSFGDVLYFRHINGDTGENQRDLTYSLNDNSAVVEELVLVYP